jgi:hypothetical protein
METGGEQKVPKQIGQLSNWAINSRAGMRDFELVNYTITKLPDAARAFS